MAGEADAEHVEALALEPVGPLPDAPYAGHLECRAFVEHDLQPQEAAKREGPEVPHDFNRGLEVPVLHRCDVTEVFVALAGIVMQPLHDLEQARSIHVDRRLAPHDLTARDGAAEMLSEGDG